MEKKYEWSADICAPREYPIEVYTGAVGGYFFSQMGGFSNGGWGSGNGDSNIKAPLPDRLDMTWLSYVDNKFYTGEWELPKEKIKQLFDEGYYCRPGLGKEKESYSIIKVGFAPKGMVVVWVMGAGQQVEVARFQAHETTIDPKLITEEEKYMFRENYSQDRLTNDFVISKELRAHITKFGYPVPEVYETYREKYMWKSKVILPEGCKINSLYIKMCNGENVDPYDKPLEMKNRAIPFIFQIYWSTKIGKKEQKFVSRIAFTHDQDYWAKFLKADGSDDMPIDFDKNEIRGLFKDHIDKNKATEIIIKIDPTKKEDNEWITDFYIEQGEKKYDFKQICQDSGKL